MNEQNGGLTVGVDLGGTKIAAGTVDPGGEVVSRVRVPTPHDPDRIAGAIAEAVQRVRTGWDDVRAVGVGAAGYVDADRSTVRFAPNLGWHDKEIRRSSKRPPGFRSSSRTTRTPPLGASSSTEPVPGTTTW